MGTDSIRERLTPLVRAVERQGRTVVWSVRSDTRQHRQVGVGVQDPRVPPGIEEVQGFFEVHRVEGTCARGIHVEMTGRDVTECVGGVQDISDEGLAERYHTHCDPRLNASQSIEIAFRIARILREERDRLGGLSHRGN